MSETPAYRRVVLKMSGEVLGGETSPINYPAVEEFLQEVREVWEKGVEVILVVGGGNIFRGAEAERYGIGRAAGDYAGMLATVINGIILQELLEGRLGVDTRLMTAHDMKKFAEPFIRRRALRHLQKGRVVILAGGTGNPYFTTDSAAALRAAELNADLILKGTKVDGVYDRDPSKDSDARLLRRITYDEILNRGLRVMDATAVALCRDEEIPIVVFNIRKRGYFFRIVVNGELLGTFVSKGG